MTSKLLPASNIIKPSISSISSNINDFGGPHLSAKILENYPLGPMLVVGNDTHVFLLNFLDRSKVEQKLKRLTKESGLQIFYEQTSEPIRKLENELDLYFQGKLKKFETPLCTSTGTLFQNIVWDELKNIPYNKQISYANVSENIHKAKSYRAVAQACSANPICIVIPCHRVIGSNQELGGYTGGLDRKEWLIEHEKKYQYN